MKLDRANRAFVAVVGVGWLLGGYAICGAVAGVLVPALVAHVSRDGWQALVSGSALPALAVLVLVALGVVRAVRTAAWESVASRRVSGRIDELAVDHPARLVEAARAAGVAGRVVLVADPETFSLVHGAVRPRVVISVALLERLSDAELRAVLVHERYHVTNLDPLKSLVIRVLNAGLLSFPALRPMASGYTAARELAADRLAISECGRRPLAGALLQAVHGPDWCVQEVVVPLAAEGVLGARVAQLELGEAPRSTAREVARVWASAAATLLTLGVVAAACTAGLDRLGYAGASRVAARALVDGITCSGPFAAFGIALFLALAMRRALVDKRSSAGDDGL